MIWSCEHSIINNKRFVKNTQGDPCALRHNFTHSYHVKYRINKVKMLKVHNNDAHA